ncbi:hypothetical protein RRG08_017307 [Elysia crispata]|uniref:Uncharacterized protein n=1 Tax=Elysia crispata TaxID=231223 RepID=A0AAE1D4E2_9GAST|nr:hypothetical protein RRG08_017307 [Elysia crispata]
MTFSDDECIPTGSHFGKTQRLLCMASWMQDGNGFAMLRKENERAFYCSRIIFSANNEVKEMIIYLSWMCYRDTDFNSHNLRLSIHTNYVRFRSPVKTIISLPCRANEQTCSPVCKNGQCTRTCSQCLNSTGVPTEMDPDVVGSWLIGGPHGTSTMENSQSLMDIKEDKQKYLKEADTELKLLDEIRTQQAKFVGHVFGTHPHNWKDEQKESER